MPGCGMHCRPKLADKARYKSSILFLDKTICRLIMVLIVRRPKNKIPAFPKAGEKPMVYQLFQPNSEKGSFSNFSSISSRSAHPVLKLASYTAVKAYAEGDCSKLFVLQQTQCVSAS